MGTIQINFRKNFNKKPLIIKAKNIKKAVEKAAKNKIDLSGAILDKADLDGVNLKERREIRTDDRTKRTDGDEKQHEGD